MMHDVFDAITDTNDVILPDRTNNRDTVHHMCASQCYQCSGLKIITDIRGCPVCGASLQERENGLQSDIGMSVCYYKCGTTVCLCIRNGRAIPYEISTAAGHAGVDAYIEEDDVI